MSKWIVVRYIWCSMALQASHKAGKSPERSEYVYQHHNVDEDSLGHN
jgi:hypothetical protein